MKHAGYATVDQPSPVPNQHPSMHDMVIADILSRDHRWDLSVGSARHIRDRVADDLHDRKLLGMSRYDTLLQPHNGRSALIDLYQELLDAAVYARQQLWELDEDSVEYLVVFEVYDDIVSHLTTVRRMLPPLEAATE